MKRMNVFLATFICWTLIQQIHGQCPNPVDFVSAPLSPNTNIGSLNSSLNNATLFKVSTTDCVVGGCNGGSCNTITILLENPTAYNALVMSFANILVFPGWEMARFSSNVLAIAASPSIDTITQDNQVGCANVVPASQHEVTLAYTPSANAIDTPSNLIVHLGWGLNVYVPSDGATAIALPNNIRFWNSITESIDCSGPTTSAVAPTVGPTGGTGSGDAGFPVTIDGVQYKAVTSPKNFTYAQQVCKDLNLRANLFLPRSQARAEAVIASFPSVFPNNAATGVWLRPHQQQPIWSNYFKTDNSLILNYHNYSSGEPNDGDAANAIIEDKEEDCIDLKANSKWSDVDCSGQRPFICELPPDIYKYQLLISGYHCPCQERTYEEAKAYCNMRGSRLVSINSKAEQEHVYQIAQKAYNSANGTCLNVLTLDTNLNYWIFNNDIMTEKVWRDSNGDVTWANNWDTTEPNDDDTPIEDCVEVRIGNGKWNDISCTGSAQPFCCEEYIGDPVQTIQRDRDTLFFVNDFKTRNDAQAFCESCGYNLISIRSMADAVNLVSQNFASLRLKNGSEIMFNGFWSYMTDNETEGMFKILDQQANVNFPPAEVTISAFSNFTMPGLPSADTIPMNADKDCVYLSLQEGAKIQWVNEACGEETFPTALPFIFPDPRLPFMCEKQGVCPKHTTRVDEKCYIKITSHKASFAEACTYCKKIHGGRLATFDNIAEWNAIRDSSVIDDSGTDLATYWIGGLRYVQSAFTETNFLWARDYMLSLFDNTGLGFDTGNAIPMPPPWNETQPGTDPTQGCISVTFWVNTTQWQADTCSTPWRFICEVPFN